MKRIFLTFFLLLFAFPIFSLIHFHRGGGDKLLTSQSNSPLIDRFTSNDLWGASIKGLHPTGVYIQLTEEAKIDEDKDEFLKLFFRNQNKAVETFKLFVDNISHYKNTSSLILNVVAGYDLVTKKTVPFPRDWRTVRASLREKQFNDSSKTTPTTYGSWIDFLRTANDQTLNENKADDNNFFWEQFFKAYLYFVGLVDKSKITPYSDNSFLLFLENLKVKVTNYYWRIIRKLRKISFVKFLPGDGLASLGDNRNNINRILDLDSKIFSLQDLDETMTEFVENNKRYEFFDLRNKLNTPYKDNIELLNGLIEQKVFWTTLNKVLKNNLGIQFLFLNGTRYDLENLIASFSHYDSRQTVRNFTNLPTNQFREELTKLIFANKRGIQHGVDSPDKLQKLFDDTKDRLLSSLQIALKTLQKVDPTTIRLPINGGKYNIDQLLQARNQLLNDQLDQKVIDQLQALFSNSIYATDITKVTNQLKKYKEILTFLTQFATEQKLTSLKINGPDYSFTSLIADVKKQFADFAKDSFDELQKLVEGKITLSQLETTYQESLPSSPTQEPSEDKSETKTATKSPTKKSTNQSLAIGLGTAGGVVALAGASGFAYWFLKIRKS